MNAVSVGIVMFLVGFIMTRSNRELIRALGAVLFIAGILVAASQTTTEIWQREMSGDHR